MTEEKIRKISRIYELCLTVLTVIVGGLFIAQVWAIFRLGDKPFTVENISQKFSQIAIPVWLWVIAMAAGGICLPKTAEGKPAAIRDPAAQLNRLTARLSQEDGTRAILKKHEKQRTALAWVAAAICVAAAIVSTVWLLGEGVKLTAATEFFASHEEAERIVYALPFIFAAFAAVIGFLYYRAYHIKQDTKLAMTAVAVQAKKGVKAAKPTEKISWFEKLCVRFPILRSKWWGISLRIGLFAFSGVLIIVGICNGGMASVLDKAVKICTQCIGLG